MTARPWDTEPTPRTDKRARCAESMQEEEEVVALSFARSLERRLRAAEGVLADLANAAEYGYESIHYHQAIRRADAHLYAGREEDGDNDKAHFSDVSGSETA